MIDLLLKLFRPHNKFFAEARTIMKTIRGGVTWRRSLARGGVDELLLDTWDSVFGESVVSFIRFLSPDDAKSLPEAAVAQDCQLADLLLRAMMNFSQATLMTAGSWFARLPGYFVALLDCSSEELTAGMSSLKQWWKLLMQLEAQSSSDRWVHHLLRDLVWPDNQWVRETLVMLFEMIFLSLSPELERRIRAYASSFAGTNINEDYFNRCRSREAASATEALSRQARYHVGAYSTLIEDYGRSVVNITAAAQHAAGRKPPPQGAFEQKNPKNFSFGTDAFDTMGDATYASPSPQAWKLASVAWMAVERLDGEVSLLKRCWLSLLCTPGVLMFDKQAPDERGGLVFGTTPYGCLVMRLQRLRVGSFKYWVPQSRVEGGAPWYLTPITNMDNIVVKKASLVPPARAAQLMSEGFEALHRLVLSLPSGNPEPLLTFAASEGFPQLTTFYLRKLMTELGVSGGFRKSPTEKEMVVRLLQHVYPDIDKQRIDEIFWLRGLQVSEVCDTILVNHADLDLLGEVLEPDDRDELKKVVKKASASKPRAKSSPGQPPAESVGSAGREGAIAPAGRAWTVRPFPQTRRGPLSARVSFSLGRRK